MLKLTVADSNDNFFRRNLLQASETGEFCNSIPNATEKNLRRRNLKKEFVETTLSESRANLKGNYLDYLVNKKLQAPNETEPKVEESQKIVILQDKDITATA